MIPVRYQPYEPPNCGETNLILSQTTSKSGDVLGYGAFAAKDFKKGDVILHFLGKMDVSYPLQQHPITHCRLASGLAPYVVLASWRLGGKTWASRSKGSAAPTTCAYSAIITYSNSVSLLVSTVIQEMLFGVRCGFWPLVIGVWLVWRLLHSFFHSFLVFLIHVVTVTLPSMITME